jgi:hypothetical protein
MHFNSVVLPKFAAKHSVILPHITFEADEVSLGETGNNTGFVAKWKAFLFSLKWPIYLSRQHPRMHMCVAGSCFYAQDVAMAVIYTITLS